MENLIIRPVRLEDAPGIQKMRCMPGIREQIYSLASERISQTENFIRNLTERDHMFVAEIQERNEKIIVGAARLEVDFRPRVNHCASIGIMVHPKYQKQGIGKQLMAQLLDLADNWLMLLRLELELFTDNEAALHLYKSLGFQIEGTRRFAAIKDGRYADIYIMARYNNFFPINSIK